MTAAVRVKLGPFGRVALVELGHCLVRHAHPHCHMLFKVAGADTHFLVDGVPSPLTDDAAVLVDAWRPHEFLYRPGQVPTQIIALYLDPEWLASFRPIWIHSREFSFFHTTCGQVTEPVRRLVMALAECLNAGTEAPFDVEFLLGELVVSMIDRYSIYGRDAPRQVNSRPVDWRIRKAIGHIHREAGNATSIDNIIVEIGMSRSNFFRQFKACTGMSPGLFQNVVRLEQAVRLTIASREPLGSAASRLGFEDPAHFSRFFRNHTAVSPREYRQGAAAFNIR